jgi:hypothetical protein
MEEDEGCGDEIDHQDCEYSPGHVVCTFEHARVRSRWLHVMATSRLVASGFRNDGKDERANCRPSKTGHGRDEAT